MSVWRYIQKMFGGEPANQPSTTVTYTIRYSRKLPNASKLHICKLLVDRIKYRDYFGNALEGLPWGRSGAGTWYNATDHAEASLRQDREYLAELMSKHFHEWWK